MPSINSHIKTIIIFLVAFCWMAITGCASALCKAAVNMDENRVDAIIKEGTDQETLDSALGCAIKSGSVGGVQLLIKKGADPNGKGSAYGFSQPILHIATTPPFFDHSDINKGLEIVNVLLDNNADIDIRLYGCITPLSRSISDINRHSDNYPIWSENTFEIFKLLLVRGANTEIRRTWLDVDTAETPLFIAAKEGNYECAKLLLEHGAFACGWNEDGILPIEIAIETGNHQILEILYRYGGRRDIAIDKQAVIKSPLHYAVLERDKDRVEMLIEQGADPQTALHDGTLPLHIAGLMGNRIIAEILLDDSCNVNALNAQGYSPLFFALQQNHTEVIDLLIQYGADFNHITCDKKNALHVAAMGGNVGIAKQAIETGVFDIDALDDSGRSPLYYAALNLNFDIAYLLLREDADIVYGHKSDFSLEAMDDVFVIHLIASIYEVMAEEELIEQRYEVSSRYFKKSIELHEQASHRYSSIADDMDTDVFQEKAIAFAGRVVSFVGTAAASAALNTAINRGVSDLRKNSLRNKQMATFDALNFAAETKTGYEGYSAALPIYMEYYKNRSSSTQFKQYVSPIDNPAAEKQNKGIGPITQMQLNLKSLSEQCSEKALLYQDVLSCINDYDTNEMIDECIFYKISNE